MIGNTLAFDGLNAAVDFSYYPVLHVAPDGSYECNVTDPSTGNVVDLDCEGTAFEACLVNAVCWYGACDAPTQQQLARFLQCYEGPGANQEDYIVDPATRGPCLEAAGFSDPNELLANATACENDAAQLDPLLDALNATKVGNL